jgi:hypothetical protein
MNLPTLYNHLEHYSKVANTLRGVQDIEAGKRYTLHDEKMVKIFKQCLDDGELAHWKRASLDQMPDTGIEKSHGLNSRGTFAMSSLMRSWPLLAQSSLRPGHKSNSSCQNYLPVQSSKPTSMFQMNFVATI